MAASLLEGKRFVKEDGAGLQSHEGAPRGRRASEYRQVRATRGLVYVDP